jgi:WD40 repeat protein
VGITSCLHLQVHNDYVDFVCFVGDSILSKCAGSCTHKLMLWSPNAGEDPDAALPLIEYTLRDCEQWFVKVGIHPSQNMIAVGTQHGKIHLLPFTDKPSSGSTAGAHPPSWLDMADLHKHFDFGTDCQPPPSDTAEEHVPPAKRRATPIVTGDEDVHGHDARPLPARVASGFSGEQNTRSHRHSDLRSSDDGGLSLESFSRDPSTVQVTSRVTVGLQACKALVRQVLFTPDGNTMIALCDDSTIWRWDFVPKSDCKPEDASYTSSDSSDDEILGR